MPTFIEHPWFADPLQTLAVSILVYANLSSRHLDVTVSAHLGLALGMAPGTTATIQTAAGPVTIYSLLEAK